MNIRETFGLNMKVFRKYKGMTQSDLANELGVTLCTVSCWETGKIKCPKLETIEKIAEVLNVSVKELFNADAASIIKAHDINQLIEELAGIMNCSRSDAITYCNDMIREG